MALLLLLLLDGGGGVGLEAGMIDSINDLLRPFLLPLIIRDFLSLDIVDDGLEGISLSKPEVRNGTIPSRTSVSVLRIPLLLLLVLRRRGSDIAPPP